MEFLKETVIMFGSERVNKTSLQNTGRITKQHLESWRGMDYEPHAYGKGGNEIWNNDKTATKRVRIKKKLN